MNQGFHVATLIGSTSGRSRTQALAQAIVDALAQHLPVRVEAVELSRLGSEFGCAATPDALGPAALAALRTLEHADLVVAATPVYKGSYSGLFKHVIDFLDPDALVGRPVILAATGGGDRHALVVEHQLRPLFGFFRAQTVPAAVYASEAELQGYAVCSASLQRRIDEAARQAALLLRLAEPRAEPALCG
jgi:FMN reductase